MEIEKLQQLAEQQRRTAKLLFGESIRRDGCLNPDLPMARFVDAVINAAMLEISLAQLKAQEPKQ